MRAIILALLLASCGGVDEPPADVVPDVHHVDMQVQMPPAEEIPPEYSAPPRMAVPPPWVPEEHDPWDDLIKPPPPEPPPCIVCEDGPERMPQTP